MAKKESNKKFGTVSCLRCVLHVFYSLPHRYILSKKLQTRVRCSSSVVNLNCLVGKLSTATMLYSEVCSKNQGMDEPLVNVFFSPTFIQMHSCWERAQSATVCTDPSDLAWFNKELKKPECEVNCKCCWPWRSQSVVKLILQPFALIIWFGIFIPAWKLSHLAQSEMGTYH